MSRSIFVAGDSNLKQLGCLLNLPNLFLLTVPGAKLVGDITNFKFKVLDVVRAQKPDLLILHIGSNDVGKDFSIFTRFSHNHVDLISSYVGLHFFCLKCDLCRECHNQIKLNCYRDFICQLLEMNPTMLVTVCGILPRTTSNFKSFHWNSAVLPDLQRGCAALNDVIMNLRRECDKCHFLDYNPLFDRSMHLARDGLHVNINGAYVLKTVLESFVVSLDMEQINSAEKVLSLDLVDTRMSYADVVKHFPPRDKLKSMDYKDKESCICSKKPFIPKFRRYKRYRVPISTRVKKDRHIHAACTHQKPKLKRLIQKIIPAKVFCCPECRVKCTKEDFLLNHYLSRHVPHRKKMEEIMYKDASFKPNHMKEEIYTCKASSHISSITDIDFIALDVPEIQLFGMKCEQRDQTVLSNCLSFVKKIAAFCWENFAKMKLILSGDVEENPGPPVIECSWESCTETFQTEQLLGQHVIGYIHPGMLCQWRDCFYQLRWK